MQDPVVIDEAGSASIETFTKNAMALAKLQAERDAELYAALQKKAIDGAFEVNDDELPRTMQVSGEEALRPLNRAERRQMVAEFKSNLRNLPRATPVRNATIIPKSARRKRKS